MNKTSRILSSIALFLLAMGPSVLAAESLNVHGIFRSNMVLQRDKPAPPPTPAREAPGNQGWKREFLAIAFT
jgi:hypothetical protein